MRTVCVLVSALLSLSGAPAWAAGNSNNSGGGGDTSAECRADVEGSQQAALAICGNLSANRQRQVCDPEMVCSQYVELVCGDVVSVCQSDDTLFSIAHAVGKANAACLLSHETSQQTAVSCAESALSCGDTNVSNTNECPPVNVTVDEADVDCARCVERRAYFPDGSVKSTKQQCFKCNVSGTLEIN